MKYIYTYILVLFFIKQHAQNLVPNWSFEDTLKCYDAMQIYSSPIPSQPLEDWFTFNSTTPDYFNTCANTYTTYGSAGFYSGVPRNYVGYQYPKTGSAYTGIALILDNPTLYDTIAIYEELLIVQLKKPLKQNQCYYAEFFYSSANSNNLVINRLGMHIASSIATYTSYTAYGNNIKNQIEIDTNSYVNDTLNWTKVSGTFMAQGGEQYIHIGNFRDGLHVKKQNVVVPPEFGNHNNFLRMCYVYIDDVSLYELPQHENTSINYTMCPLSDSLVLGDSVRVVGIQYQWFVNGVIADTINQIKVKPNTTTVYELQVANCTTQTFVINYQNDCPMESIPNILNIPNIFTPNGDNVNEVWQFTLPTGSEFQELNIYNRWGNEIFKNQNKIEWNGGNSNDGTYFYIVKYTNQKGEVELKKGLVNLTR